MTSGRPDPAALLARLRLDGARAGRGRLKVFLGAHAGVGKTYAMLAEAQQLRREGRDVAAGYVETHGRSETDALLEGLEILPRREAEHRGIRLSELDLDVALARRPELLLVDELAHSNAPGLRHAKRWQDVEELLAAGITVYTTLNVQHLESLNDLVARITSVRVRETVPDTVLAGADEVELVDIPPEELLKRLAAGKVYVPEQARRARESFFTRPNLAALRQLALRQVAARVDDQMRVYRRAGAVERTWPVAERILVGVGPAPSSRRLVRAASRMADPLGAEWVALFVETPGYAGWPEEDRARVWETMRLAERLGARTVTASGTEPAEEILRWAREHNVSKLVVGKPPHPRWRDVLLGSKLDRMVRRSSDIDVYVISGDDGDDPPPPRAPRASTGGEARWKPYGAAAALALAATGVAALLSGPVAPVNQAMVYLLASAAAAARYGRGPAVLAAVLGVAAFDFFFVPPRLTLAVSDAAYLPAFGVMLAVALGMGTLTARLREQGEVFRGRERRTAALYDLSRDLLRETTAGGVLSAGLRQVRGVFGVEATAFVPDGRGKLRTWGKDGGEPGLGEGGVLRWVLANGRPAGTGTATLPGADGLYLPLAGAHGTGGVLRVRASGTAPFAGPGEMHFLEAFAGQTGAALERIRLAKDAARGERLREMDRARTRFVARAAHHLRLPVRRVEKALGGLRGRLAPGAEAAGAADLALEEAGSLRALVDDLVELSRLEGGRAGLVLAPVAPAEVVRRAVDAFAARAAERGITLEWECDDALPPVLADAARVEDALGRLLANALRFADAGGRVLVTADEVPGAVQIAVAESGTEIPPDVQGRIFDAFAAAPGEEDAVGTGLDLPVARAIVQAHGGAIWVDSGPGPGSVFSFTLPRDAEGEDG